MITLPEVYELARQLTAEDQELLADMLFTKLDDESDLNLRPELAEHLRNTLEGRSEEYLSEDELLQSLNLELD